VGASIGEGNYYFLLGSALELAMLAGIVVLTWTWPRIGAPRSAR
jgi:hypothetical protein